MPMLAIEIRPMERTMLVRRFTRALAKRLRGNVEVQNSLGSGSSSAHTVPHFQSAFLRVRVHAHATRHRDVLHNLLGLGIVTIIWQPASMRQ